MSVIALVDPATLLGQAVRDLFGARGSGHEIRLLDSAADAEGTLTQIGSEVALVHAVDRKALADVDLAVLCGSPEQQHSALGLIPESTPVVSLERGGGGPDGDRVVAGINDARRTEARVRVSPHPVVVALAHLLQPLLEFEPRWAAATVLLPASLHDEAGLDELFEQTRGILNFQGEMPTDVFPAQLAFNLLPNSTDEIGRQTAEIVDADLTVSVALVQAPVFHSLGVSVHVELARPAPADDVRAALAGSACLELRDDEPHLGPIDAAGREEILLGSIDVAPAEASDSTRLTLWAVMDNLARGGASNAVELAERVLARA